jgi:hypothetical protein
MRTPNAERHPRRGAPEPKTPRTAKTSRAGRERAANGACAQSPLAGGTCWCRTSRTFASRALAELGCLAKQDGPRRLDRRRPHSTHRDRSHGAGSGASRLLTAGSVEAIPRRRRQRRRGLPAEAGHGVQGRGLRPRAPGPHHGSDLASYARVGVTTSIFSLPPGAPAERARPSPIPEGRRAELVSRARFAAPQARTLDASEHVVTLGLAMGDARCWSWRSSSRTMSSLRSENASACAAPLRRPALRGPCAHASFSASPSSRRCRRCRRG